MFTGFPSYRFCTCRPKIQFCYTKHNSSGLLRLVLSVPWAFFLLKVFRVVLCTVESPGSVSAEYEPGFTAFGGPAVLFQTVSNMIHLQDGDLQAPKYSSA